MFNFIPGKLVIVGVSGVGVCMGGGQATIHCIVACTHLGNGTGRRIVTLMALLLLNNGHGAVLHSCGTHLVGGERVRTCDGAHSWRLYSAASLGHQAADTMSCGVVS